MNHLLLKNYVNSSLNEIRGELTRDDNFIKELCIISGLMFYKNYIKNIEKITVNYEYKTAEGSYLRPINWKEHEHIDTIKKCIDEVLEESKEKLTSLNSENIFPIESDSESNEHYKLFRDNISNDIYHKNLKNTSNNNRFSILIYDTENLPFIEKGTKGKIKRYDSKREDLFGKQEIKIHKYIVLTFINAGGSNKTERETFNSSTTAQHRVLRTKRFSKKPESIFISRIRLFFNNKKHNRNSFKNIILDLIKTTYTHSGWWSYNSIKKYILESVSNKESNSSLEKIRGDLNHEMVHHKQYLNSFKITKYDEKFLGTHRRYGLPEVPFNKKLYKVKSRGDYWNVDSWNPHRQSIRHEMKPIEFYARLSDEWNELKERLVTFNYILYFNINKQKIVSSGESVNKVINEIMLDYREDSYWLKHLFSSARKYDKKAETYYKKAIKELYKLSIEYVNKVEKDIIDLYKKNKDKILSDIENKKNNNKAFYITKNYLEKIDKVEKFSDLDDSDRVYYFNHKDSESVSNYNFFDVSNWTKEHVISAVNSKEHNLSKVIDDESIRMYWLDSMEGVIPEIIYMTDQVYLEDHAKELLGVIRRLIIQKDLFTHNKDENKQKIKDYIEKEYPEIYEKLF